jgi:hypothetical protein
MPGYLGDKSSMIVHHLAVMREECNIHEIRIKDKQYFNPDSIDEAKKHGFSPCKWCIK